MNPLAFYFSKSRIKAIVLGADPTNESDLPAPECIPPHHLWGN